MESVVKSVVLVPHPEGLGPKERTVLHWDTVYHRESFGPPAAMEPQEITFAPRPAKQIWIVGRGWVRTSGCSPGPTSSAGRGSSRWTPARGGGERLVALWVPGKVVDRSPEAETDGLLPGVHAERVIGIDILNGREQDLVISRAGGGTMVRGLLVKDFPVFLRF